MGKYEQQVARKEINSIARGIRLKALLFFLN